jgi:hypothetical protein
MELWVTHHTLFPTPPNCFGLSQSFALPPIAAGKTRNPAYLTEGMRSILPSTLVFLSHDCSPLQSILSEQSPVYQDWFLTSAMLNSGSS